MGERKKLVILTGAGISAESGLRTFRDADGLWEGYNVYDVATPEAWEENPELVQQFYNERRKQVRAAKPNAAHIGLAELEEHFDIDIITQNIDDLHERAGSTRVTHLHGIITKSQSSARPELVYDLPGDDILMGECCALGSQLRPHVVWFGEAVPMIEPAALICSKAELFVLIGTSLAVYPAAGLISYVQSSVTKYIIDPITPDVKRYKNTHLIQKSAVNGITDLRKILLNAK
ncbi:SIR2 family NAD-dependent protein deacylase [Pedobacter sp. AW1-32]|uniref:SIR2 family NAD-dependent protein deacylase n=1 Tax=Pedobacter sp. AW1-32 TaxID=3383026 RepID=UPI003FF07ABD